MVWSADCVPSDVPLCLPLTITGSFVLFNVYGVAITGEDANHERKTLKMAVFKVNMAVCARFAWACCLLAIQTALIMLVRKG